MAPVRASVLDIVVDEREVVEQLDRGGDGRRVLRPAADGLGHEHRDQRPDAFALDRFAGLRLGRLPGGVREAQMVSGHRLHEGRLAVERAERDLCLTFEEGHQALSLGDAGIVLTELLW